MESNEINDVIKAINQAAMDAHDGAYGHKEAGLKREEGDLIKDKRVADGFGVSIHGNTLCIKYQSEIKLTDTHDKKFQSEMEDMIEEIVSYLKREFRKTLKKTLTLKRVGEIDILAQDLSRVRAMVQVKGTYEIGNLPKEEKSTDAKKRYDKIDTMLAESYDPYLAWKKHTGNQ